MFNEITTSFSIVAGVFGLYSVYLAMKHLRLVKYGKKLNGVVKNTLIGADSDSYHLIVEYVTESGEVYQQQSRQSFFGWQNHVGKVIRLLYFPSDPRKVYIEKDLMVQYIGSFVFCFIFALIAFLKRG
jgi:hypothetical protein